MRRGPTLLGAALALAACKQSASAPVASSEPAREIPPSPATQPAKPAASAKPAFRIKPFAATADARLGTLPEGVGLAPGSKVPDVRLRTHLGEPVQLARVIETSSPLLLIFYRGGW